MNTEKSQEQIIFENICMERCMGDYRGYPLGSSGNVVHWLRALGFRNYDTVQVGNGVVEHWGKVLATFTINNELGMPIFNFNKEEYKWLQHQQDTYIACIDKYENPYKQYLK